MKRFFLFLLFVFISFIGYSQAKFQSGLSLGIATTQYDGDSHGGYHKFGINAGGYSVLNINKSLQLGFEINFVQKGARFIPDSLNLNSYEYLLKLNYIEVPLLVKYIYKKFKFETGVGIGFLMSSYEETNYVEITNDPFKKNDFTYQLGISYPIFKVLEMNWRFSYSLIPVRQYEPDKSFTIFKGDYNNVMSFTLRYTFGKNKETNATE